MKFRVRDKVRHRLTGEIFLVIDVKENYPCPVNVIVRDRKYNRLGFLEHELEEYSPYAIPCEE